MSMERTAVGHLELGARWCGTQPQPPSRPNLLLKRRDCRRRWFMLLALTISINAGSVPWHSEIRGRLEALDSKKRHGRFRRTGTALPGSPRRASISTPTGWGLIDDDAFRGRIRIDGMPCGRSSSTQRQDMLFSASFPFFACVRGRRTSRRSETAYSYQTPKKDHSRTEQRLPLPPGNARQRPPGNLPRPAVAITASRSTRRRPARRMKYGTPI